MVVTILVWNCDNVNHKWDQLLLLIEEFSPTLIFLQEAKLRRSEITDLNNRSKDYKFFALLPEDIAPTIKEKLKIATSPVKYGLLIGIRREDNTKVKLYDKIDNSHFIIERDGLILGNIYMPQRKLLLSKYGDALTSIQSSIDHNGPGKPIFLAGDWNLGATQGPGRHILVEEKISQYNLVKIEPDCTTNYNFCGAETRIDYAYHSPNLTVSLEPPHLTHV